jgi:glycosyltransferase 2 family protein
VSEAGPPGRRRTGGRLSLLGLGISAIAVAGVVWWALRQEPPELPSSAGELGALVAALALYAANTVIRGERWRRLLLAEGARARAGDTQALNAIGYAGNNLLPARAGDAIRVVLAAPRMATSRRAVIGTLVAERLLDIAVILALFVVVGYGLLGEVGARSLEVIALVAAALAVGAVAAVAIVRRNERVHRFLAPMASATVQLRGAHGARLLAITIAIWAVESLVWLAVGGAVGLGLSVIEALYLVALASVFSLIPSGPGYAGTQDAATIIGIRALGGSGSAAVAYLVMLRLVIVVPVTVVGVGLLVWRYGGWNRLRAARLELP